MKKFLLYCLLVLFLILLFFRHNDVSQKENIKPDKTVVIEPDILPILKSNIVYDFSEANKISKEYRRNIILIFAAEWCDYCKKLKNQIQSKSLPLLDQYVICIIDIEKNQELTKQYNINRLPTSILLNDNKQEWSRNVGYQKEEYELWLKGL